MQCLKIVWSFFEVDVVAVAESGYGSAVRLPLWVGLQACEASLTLSWVGWSRSGGATALSLPKWC